MQAGSCTRSLALALSAALALGASASAALAQGTGAIRGTVTNAETGQQLNGAQISVVGTQRGALSNLNGDFLILNVPPGEHVLRVQLIGYHTVEQRVTVLGGETESVNVTLATAAIQLDELVVTGTAGAVAKRSIGNAIAVIQADEIMEKVTNQTVSQLLQAKATGVTYLNSGGTVGTGGSIRIRGASSLVAGNDPVIYVDGVRVYSGHAGNWDNMWCMSCIGASGGQHAMALDQVNPDDIASIEIIKGPAAATLYGSDAAAGVIQIITKKGQAGQQALRLDAGMSMGAVDWSVEGIRNYTACTQERIDDTITAENGDEVPAYPGCAGNLGAILDYSAFEDNPNGIRTGEVRNYNVSISGGGDGYSFYGAADRDHEEGIFLNNFVERASVRTNFAFYPMEKVDFSVKVGYTNTHTRHPFNDNGGLGLVISAAQWRPGYNYEALGYERERWGYAWSAPTQANEYDNQLWGDRLIMGSTVNYRPWDWFRNRVTVGYDYNQREAIQYGQMGSSISSEGFVYERRPLDEMYTVDYSGTIEHQLREGLTSNTSFGGQWIRHQYKDTRAYGWGFGSPLHRLVQQAATRSSSDAESQTASLGIYLQQQLGFNNRLFLTGAVRMDNNSVFGERIERIFYPKFMGSWVISEEGFFDVPYVDQLRLRFAWGQAGSAPGPFDAVRDYSPRVATLGDGSSVPGLVLSSYGNPDLKPERGDELEAGFDLSVLENRAGLELTYYHKRMTDALMYVPVPPSSGFTGSRLENIGETRNSGLELTLTGTPVQQQAVTWDSRLSLYTNENELVRFGFDRSPIWLGFYGSPAPQSHQEGYPLAGFWAREVLRDSNGDFVRDAEGDLVLRQDTIVVDGVTSYQDEFYVGPSTPTWEVGFSNTITLFGRLDLFALLDIKGGHYQYNYKQMSACSGRRCERAANAEATLADASASPEAQADAQRTLDLLTADGGVSYYYRTRQFIEPADFLKLRDVSVTYRVPESWANRIGADRASISLAGHDLFVYAPDYTGPDPEVNYYGSQEFRRVDAWTAPMLRRLTATFNVSF